MKSDTKVFIAAVLTTFFVVYTFTLYFIPSKQQMVLSGEALSGKDLWQQHNCTACHQVYGLGGFLGPDLTNVYSRRKPEYIDGVLRSGIGAMPDFHLSVVERRCLIEYLRYMNTTGTSDPRTFTLNSNGTISK